MFTRFWVIFLALIQWGTLALADTQTPEEVSVQNTPKVEAAVDVDEFFKYMNEPRISLEYNRGEYLIYDCKKQSFICVNKESFEACGENRVLAKEEKKHNLACAPLLSFKTQKACFEKQITNIERARIKTYCYGEIKKLKL